MTPEVVLDERALARVSKHRSDVHPLTKTMRNPNVGRQRQWRWMHRLYRGSELLIETIHGSEGSIYMELQASASRVERGEATRIEAGVIP